MRRLVAFAALANLTIVGMSLVASPFSVAEDLQTIQRRGHLIVAVKDNLPPLGFRNKSGQLQGLEVEIAERLSQELLGKPNAVVLKPVLNQERITALLKGQADVAIARMTMNSMRSRVVAFSVPYYLDGTALITRDSSLQKPLDLSTQSVAVLNNSTTVETIRNRFPQVKLVSVASYEAAQNLLERGEVATFAADASVLSGWVREFPQYRLLTPTLSVEPLCIVLPKGLKYDELRRQINLIVNRWQEQGWLKQRAIYWGLP